MRAIDDQLDRVCAIAMEGRVDVHHPELVRGERGCECGCDEERCEAAHHGASSNVIDAHQLSQSALAPAGAACMCTALMSPKPGRFSATFARPFASVRTAI